MFIYKIENIVNKKVYIGMTEKTIEERFKKHIQNAEKNINRHLYDAINCYGIENFEVSEIEKCVSKEQLCEREKFWINHYNSTDRSFGYNMMDGGLGGAQPLEVRRRAGIKISKTNKGRIVSEETKKKISLSHIGIKHSQATKEKISDMVKNQKNRVNISEWATGRFGKLSPQYKDVDIEKVKIFLQEGKSCKIIAKYFDVSYATLGTKFKQEVGITILEYKRKNNLKRRNNK